MVGHGLSRIYSLACAGTPFVILRTFDPLLSVQGIPDPPKGRVNQLVVLRWGLGEGCQILKGEGADYHLPEVLRLAKSPQQLVQALNSCGPQAYLAKIGLVVLAMGFGSFVLPTDPGMTQMLLSALPVWKENGVTLVAVQAPGFAISGGLLERYCEYVDAPLPTALELQDLYLKALESLKQHLPKGVKPDPDMGQTLKGLTIWQAEQALFEFFTSHNKPPRAMDMLEVKEGIINSSPALRLITQYPDLSEVKGLTALKDFILGSAMSPLSRGVCLLGLPGCGKSLTAQAVASSLKRPLVELNISSVFGGVVGQSEAAMRQAIELIKACAPCLVFIDEIEKVLSGVASSGRSDGGTTERVAKELLTFLQDRPEGIYVIATSNDPLKIPPEYLRAERWDALFFLDLPIAEARKEMLDQYKAKYGITSDNSVTAADLEGWTGAEISTLCRIVAMRRDGALSTSLLEAKTWVVPQSVTRESEIQAMREWAKGKCVSADGDLVPKGLVGSSYQGKRAIN